MGYPNVKDAELIETKALPDSATTIYTDPIDLGALTANGARLADVEFLVEAPALAAADLGDAATMKYKVQMDDDSAFGSPTTLIEDIIVQTGANSSGAAAASARFRVPSNCERYIRVAATNSAAGDASDISVTFSACF